MRERGRDPGRESPLGPLALHTCRPGRFLVPLVPVRAASGEPGFVCFSILIFLRTGILTSSVITHQLTALLGRGSRDEVEGRGRRARRLGTTGWFSADASPLLFVEMKCNNLANDPHLPKARGAVRA